jgi:hypothetical protein
MNAKRRLFLMTSVLLAAVFAAVDLKNYFVNRAPFYVSDDLFDKFKIYATIPGAIPAFFIVLLVYQNAHAFNFYVLESITILLISKQPVVRVDCFSNRSEVTGIQKRMNEISVRLS